MSTTSLLENDSDNQQQEEEEEDPILPLREDGFPGRNLVIGRSKSKQPARRRSLQAVTVAPSALNRSWSGKSIGVAPFRRAQTETILTSSSTSSDAPYSGLSRSQTSLNMSVRSKRSLHKSAVMRRMSSFGGAPIFIPAPPVSDAETHDGDDQHPPSSNIRWAVLILTCLLLFGNYYAYDNPAALNRPLQQYLGHDYDTWQYELNLLYSVYSFPNMFLPFVGGQLVDRLDVKKVLICFSAVVCLGQTLFAVGVSLKHFGTMLIGRILFGIGGESIGVVQASITTAWFKGKELAFALGLNLCIARFGSVVNANMSPRIEKIWTSSGAVWVGGLTCYVSFGCALILALLMSSYSPASARSPKGDAGHNGLDEERPLIQQPSNSTGSLNMSKEDVFNDAGDSEDDNPSRTIKDCLSDIIMFPWEFWLVCLICVLLYGTVVPFNNIASDFLMSKWYPGDTQTAGTVMSIPDTMSAILVPFCGVLVDRYGGRATLLVVCALVIAAVHTTLGLTMLNPIYPLLFLGLSYSIYGVAIWPSIATIIQHQEDTLHEENPHLEPPKLLGTAYGLSTSALNTALTIMPLVAAQIRVWGGSFVPVELFFVGLALAGAVASGVLWIVDVRNGSILQMPEIEHEEVDEEEKDFHAGYGAIHRSGSPENDGRVASKFVEDGTGSNSPLSSQERLAQPTKYANKLIKPGKAFGVKVKNRARLDVLLTDSPISETGDGSSSDRG